MAKILFVEDDPLIVKIYTTRLTADGFEVLTADNGEEGLRLAEEKIPDLIVLDIMMPKMDGFGVLERLRANEKLKSLPILVYSNLAQEDEMARAVALGATEFIIKANLSPTEMVAKIKQYLKSGVLPTSASAKAVSATQVSTSVTSSQPQSQNITGGNKQK